MPTEDIIVGRSRKDMEKYNKKGAVLLGKHTVGEGEEIHLTNPIKMDVVKPHIVLVTGKRGSGKSYTGGVIGEEITMLPKEIKKNLSVLMVDTMGIFWSMSKPNTKDIDILSEWNLKPKGMNVRLFVPKKFMEEYKDVGVDVYKPLTLPCGEVTAVDWILTFGFNAMDEYGLAIERVINKVKKKYGKVYSISDIIKEIEADKTVVNQIKNALISRFEIAKDWGIFEKIGTAVKDLFERGEVSIVDVSHFTRTGVGWGVRTVLIGLLSRRILDFRIKARKKEEFEVMGGTSRKTIPMVWLMIDEAHQFIGSGKPTAATEPLLTLVKEGREPGISLLLITQMPNKLHPEALSQSDIIISHRLTSASDIKALRSVMQTYVLKDIEDLINALPRQTGAAIILDDNSERIYTVQIRPRLSWHAGGSPSAIKKRGLFD